jgi:hypothetical protein
MKQADLHGLKLVHDYLGRCEHAAEPPPQPPAPVFGGLLSPNFVSQAQTSYEGALGRARHPRTLLDVLHGQDPPFQADEVLGNDRAARIKTLNEWLHRFPAFQSLQRTPALEGGFRAFQNVSRRRKSDPKLNDDCAYFRYWSFAAHAMSCTHMTSMPQPNAEQRKVAAAAAKQLLAIALKTRLFTVAGINFDQSKMVESGLKSLLSIETTRRKRFDTYTGDREFVTLLAVLAHCEFEYVSPAIICEVAALKVKNPDKVAITKQVSEFKQSKV